jgi:hypothetical protein
MTPFSPSPLPEPLRGRPFTVGQAFGAGASPDRLRALDLDRRIHGVRAPAGSSDDLRSRCLMFLSRFQASVFVSDSTAARLLGAPLPIRFDRALEVHVTAEAPQRAPHAAGLIGHSRTNISGDVITDPDGLRRSSPERVVLELAGVLDLPDLVAVIDFAIRPPRPMTTIEAVNRRLETGDRLTRRRVLRAALSLADPRSESRPESRLRVMASFWGLGVPLANHPVVDPISGLLMRIDVAFPDLMLALEYQSDEHHSGPQKRREDLTRRSRLEALGWTVVEVNGDDLRTPAELRARIHAILATRHR